jgi:hypothetical protein
MSAPAVAQVDSTLLEWVTPNAPYGFDVTYDGTVWLSVAQVGQSVDYAVRAKDLRDARKAASKRPSFWVRGYHKRNASVRYRETKARMTLDCEGETITTAQTTYYDAAGQVVGQQGYVAPSYIVPGSYGAAYLKLFCEP